MLIDNPTLATLEAALSALSPLDLLRLTHEVFGPRAAILSSMQRAGTALCHLADRARLGFDVLFVDTGVLHAETLSTRDRLIESHPHLRVRTLMPERSFEQQTRDEGLLYLSKEGQERCCGLRKSEPLAKVKGEYDVLIGALRKGEGGPRASVTRVAVDPALSVLRIHPFADWSAADLNRYFAEHPDVVLNPLHLMGFPTIGCFPCTTPGRPDEDERAGRWRHLADVAYCGINPTDRAGPVSTGGAAPVSVGDTAKKLFEKLGIPLQ